MPTTKKTSTAKTSTKKKAPVKKAAKRAVKKAPAKKAVKKAAKKTTRTTARKTPAMKKTPAKKSGRTKSTGKPLVVAADHESFWVRDGEILNSLLALRDALAEMEAEVYKFHATGEQNDFAQWVDAVLCDSACAKDLSAAKTPRSAKTVVVRHLKTYSV